MSAQGSPRAPSRSPSLRIWLSSVVLVALPAAVAGCGGGGGAAAEGEATEGPGDAVAGPATGGGVSVPALGASPVDPLVILGGSLFDGRSDSPGPNPGIVIADGRVRALDPDAAARAREAGAGVVELDEGEVVIPGLFDLHAHYAVDLLGEGRVDETEVYPILFLANGVTSTFPAGEVQPAKMRRLRQAIARGERVGPRLFSSGPYFGTAREGWDPDVPAEVIAAEVDGWVEKGVSGFKAKGIGPEQLRVLVRRAHEHGLTVTGHLGSGYRGSVNPRDAIGMGIDRVEHFLGGDAMPADRPAYASLVEMTPEMAELERIVRLYLEEGVYFDATLTAYGYFGEREPRVYDYFHDEMRYLTPYARELVESRLPRAVNERFECIYRVKKRLLAKFYEMGGGDLLTLGTDHPSWGEYFSGFGVHRELHAMVLAGLPPAAALRAATANAARALGVEEELGTVEVGKRADLVVLRTDPLDDIRATRDPRLVLVGGRIHRPRELLATVEGELGPHGPDELEAW